MATITERCKTVIPATEEWRTYIRAFICDGCGARAEAPGGYPPGEWVPIEVEAGENGEEGWQIVKRIYCDACSGDKLTALIRLGFGNHYHGSTNLLEDALCPGYRGETCPTPDHGMYEEDE